MLPLVCPKNTQPETSVPPSRVNPGCWGSALKLPWLPAPRGSSQGIPKARSTCCQIEHGVLLSLPHRDLVHPDLLVAVLVVEQGAPAGGEGLHPVLHLRVAVSDLEGLAGGVLPRGNALHQEGTRGSVRGRQIPGGEIWGQKGKGQGAGPPTPAQSPLPAPSGARDPKVGGKARGKHLSHKPGGPIALPLLQKLQLVGFRPCHPPAASPHAAISCQVSCVSKN